MDDIAWLDGMTGKYKEIRYQWVCGETTQIRFEYLGQEILADTGKVFSLLSRMWAYQIIAGWIIQDHMNREDWLRSAREMLSHVKNRKIVELDALPSPSFVEEFYGTRGIPEEKAAFVAANYAGKVRLLNRFRRGEDF